LEKRKCKGNGKEKGKREEREAGKRRRGNCPLDVNLK